MGVIETEIRKLRDEFRSEIKEMRKLIVGKLVAGSWVEQKYACVMINVKPRQLCNIRVHLDKDDKKVGCIRWKKGKGRSVFYYKPDLEKYIGEHSFN